MALQYSPKISTEGLVLCLDPGNNKSLPSYTLPVKGGLALWLDASDDTTFTYSSGTSISQWRDKSGNNFHASQGTVASQPSRSTTQNSRKTVTFDGTNDTVTIPNFVCNSEMSIFVVSNCGNTLFIEHSAESNNNWGFYFYGGGGGMFKIKRANGSFTSQTNWLSGGYSIASGTNSTGLDLLTYKDGTQQSFTSDSRNSITNSYVTDTLYIGSRGASSLWSSGPIAEIIIYNRKVTLKELKQVHTYLGLKWGISNTDRTIHDLTFNNDSKLGEGTVANMPRFDYYNGGALAFDGVNDYFYVNDGSSVPYFTPDGSTVSVNLWFKPATINTGASNKMIFSDNCSPEFSLHQVDNTVYAYSYYGVSATIQADKWYNACWTSNAGAANVTSSTTTVTFYLDGQLVGTNSGATGNGLNDLPFTLGKDPCVAGTNWSGSLGPLYFYNRIITAKEVKQNYEALKPRFFDTIVQSGLTLNLDASNPYSYAGVGTTWYDVSGTGNNSTLSNGPVYSNTNGGIITFDGSDDYVDVTIVNLTTTVTLEFWVTYTNLTSNMIFGFLMYDIYGYSGAIGFNTANSDVYGLTSTQVTNLGIVGNWKHMVFVMRSDVSYTNNKIYVNGVSQGLSQVFGSEYSAARSFNSGNGRISGWRNDSGYKLPGSIGLFRAYNRELSAAEILQNYNATKGRFGL